MIVIELYTYSSFQIASTYMKEDEVYGFYVKQAENLQSQLKYKEAEKFVF